jgi:hypothetical protein
MFGLCLLKFVNLWWYVCYIEVESGDESFDEDLQAAIKLSRVGAGARSSQATSNSSSSSSSGEHSNKLREQDGEEELLGIRPWVARNPEVGSKEYNWNVEQAEKARADALTMSGRSLGQELPSTISPNQIFATTPLPPSLGESGASQSPAAGVQQANIYVLFNICDIYLLEVFITNDV